MQDVFKEEYQIGSSSLPIKVFRTILPGECGVIHPHWHDSIEILYFLEGSAVVQINKEHINVMTGQIVLLNAFDIHSVSGITEYIVLQFEPRLTGELHMGLIKAFPLPDNEKILTQSPSCNRHIQSIITNLQDIDSAQKEELPGYEINMRGCIYKIIAAVFAYSHERKFEISQYNMQKIKMERLNNLFNHIEMHYTEKISIPDAAKLLNLTSNYFCRYFKQVMGMTFLDYLNMYRCIKAEELICTTDKLLTDVALSSGFSSVSYFNRIFKKYKGVPPSLKRKSIG